MKGELCIIDTVYVIFSILRKGVFLLQFKISG